MTEVQMYNHRGASEYLGVHPKTLEYRVMRGLITPLRLKNNDRMYKKADLDALKEKMQSGDGLFTMQEIADRFQINYHRVHRAFRIRRHIAPAKVIGKIPLYNEEQVQWVAKEDEWEEPEKESA